MRQKLFVPALVILGVLAVSAGAYAASGGSSSLSGMLALEATTTGTPEATATGTVEPTATGTMEATATGTVEASATTEATATAEATGTPEATETPVPGPGNHEGGVLGIPSDDSPACTNHGGCTIITTPSGNQIRVPNSPGHQHGNPGNGHGHGNGNGDDSDD